MDHIDISSQRKHWNQQQQALRSALERSQDFPQAIALFLGQHAVLHAAAIDPQAAWSFEDQVWQDLPEAAARRIPTGEEHSIAWLFWHLARIEDVAMNLLVADSPQLLLQDNWLERLKVAERDTGNATPAQEAAALSAAIDLQALRAYRLAVGRRTRQIVQQLQAHELKQKVEPARLARALAEGAVTEAARGLLDYWSKRTIAGLLLMPPTRHNFVHLNEAFHIKQKTKG